MGENLIQLDINCLDCGNPIKKSCKFKEDGQEYDLRCVKCNLDFKIRLIAVVQKDNNRKNSGLIFNVEIESEKYRIGYIFNNNLEPVWSCPICSKKTLKKISEFLPDNEPNEYECNSCGAQLELSVN